MSKIANTQRWSAGGVILIVIGVVMMQCAAAVFVSTEEPGTLLRVVGAISFFTWWIPVLLGIAVLAYGQFRRRD